MNMSFTCILNSNFLRYFFTICMCIQMWPKCWNPLCNRAKWMSDLSLYLDINQIWRGSIHFNCKMLHNIDGFVFSVLNILLGVVLNAANTGFAAPLPGRKAHPLKGPEWNHTLQWLPLQKYVPISVHHPLGYRWGICFVDGLKINYGPTPKYFQRKYCNVFFY